ncbi:L,D-transpeptidase family protein [Aliihoeflea aestuarii]|jgi:L,D-peptidoglycan transpeptidase YkuD (ErfK/YbiS/YcfS/YnhG family)|uniref:L,D-transpeptidase family protein n=1 Tax=Aliihoeflea aestuarii TaxID=453840 RepID=UPI002092CDAE|nr:L,D-transpeptidase family protein [Aliihoeflea aestuarii]MCO6391439.1 L,D-transpeptidase family protein [Aliihoeflea aestuarii]
MVVRPAPLDQRQGLLCVAGRVIRCALGRGGIKTIKREGDGATPLGSMRLMHAFVRRDRMRPLFSGLSLKPIGEDDGWCDAPADRNYNRPVSLPYKASHERMRRGDHLYDVVIVLDANMRPRKRGMGSAIFFHLARPGYLPTEGCVAISRRDLEWLLPRLSPKTVLTVVR